MKRILNTYTCMQKNITHINQLRDLGQEDFMTYGKI